MRQVFLRDLLTGTTELVSVAIGGGPGNNWSSNRPSISVDGRYVAFESSATNLVPVGTHGSDQVYVRDRQTGTTELVSQSDGGTVGNGVSHWPSISADGRYVAFNSFASNLVPGDTNSEIDVFVRDRQTGTTERVSVATDGTQGNGTSYLPSMSADARYVVFESAASNLVPGDTNQSDDIFVRDRRTGTTQCVSVAPNGAHGLSGSFQPSISADGRFVAFVSGARNLVPGAMGAEQVIVRDLYSPTYQCVSVSSGGAQSLGGSGNPSISADGRFIAFESPASNLVPNDTNGFTDVFVHDRAATGFTSLCDPGAGSVIACPCSNQPSAPGLGCDNSSGTGGAILAGSGIAYLSMDSLVFTTSAEKPTATSIVMQGSALAAGGLVFGQGVRCAGGSLKRLYTKNAVGGSITAPQPGDPTVSAQSAALGDTISAGQSRWYLVYYRDPIVLGGCPAASTFNATQTVQISWSL
jgi:Tol biopolymer transport system component